MMKRSTKNLCLALEFVSTNRRHLLLTTVLLFVGSLLSSTAANAATEVFFVPSGGGLNEFTGSSGSWQGPTTYFTGVGYVIPTNSTIASFAGGGKLYVCYFQQSSTFPNPQAVHVMSSSDNVNWTVTDLSTINGGAPPPDVSSGLIGFTDSNGLARVFYVGLYNGGQSHAVFEVVGNNGSWGGQGLPGPFAANGTALAGYLFNSSPEVFYIATDGHIHQIYQSNGNYNTTDVTAASGAPLPVSGSALMGYQYNGNSPVYFIASDEHIHQIWWSPSSWKTNDVTAAAGAPLAESGSPLMGYMYGSEPTVDYIATDQHVHQMWWTGSRELTNDWTAGAGGQPFTGSPLTGTSSTGVFYLDDSFQLREYWWNGSFHSTELMAFGGPPPTGTGLAVATF